MFGNKAPFGSSTSFSSTFGASSPFGPTSSAFGANKTLGTGFGAPAFGSAPPNNTIFSTAAPSTGSIFGSSTSTFGQPGTSGSFGFTPTSSTGTGLFGSTAQQAAGSSLFQSTGTSAFGAPKSSFSGFGTAPTTGLFGQTQSSTALFGQNTSTGTGLFGSTGTSFSSAFGTGATGTTGTTVKFNAVTGTDTMLKNGVTTNINIRHQCITVMKDYEGKSLEELRVEDYLANRKGPQQSSIGTFGSGGNPTSIFGTTPTTSTGLFQTQNKTIFGSTFGNNPVTATVFGQPSQQQTTGLFGQKSIGFGAPTTTTSSFTFGTNAAPTLFGSSANTQNKSLFGTTTNPTSTPGLFGTTNTMQQSMGFGTSGFNAGFGTTNQTGGGLFGNKTGFGTTTTSAPSFAFGPNSNTNTGTSLFSAKTNTGFGNTAPFGNAASNFGIFGSNTNTGTSLFSQNKTGTGFGGSATTGFGTNLNTFGTNSGSLFGAAGNKTSGLNLGLGGFGQNTGGTTLGTSLNLPSNASVLGSDQSFAQLIQQQNQAQQQLLALAQSPYGDCPLFRNVLQDSGRREEILKPTNPAAQKAVTSNSQYKISPHPTAKMKPKPIHSAVNGQSSLFDGLDEDDALDSAFIPKRSIKKLQLKPRLSSEGSSLTSHLAENSSLENGAMSSPTLLGARPIISPLTTPITSKSAEASNEETHFDPHPPQADELREMVIGKNYTNPIMKPMVGHSLRNVADLNDTIANLNVKNNKLNVNNDDDSEKENISQDLSTEASDGNESDSDLKDDCQPNAAKIILRRPGYYTIPPLDKLAELVDENGNCFVDNFTVGRENFGNVFFYGVTNVAGLNLDDIVHFRRKEVTVYPDDEDKPPLGEGLNKRAQITLDEIWPIDKTTCKPIQNPERLKMMRYQEKLERVSMKLGVKFMDYRPETGSWVFEVKHFSKYRLLDDSDEDEEVVNVQEIKKLKVVPPQSLKHSSQLDDQADMPMKQTDSPALTHNHLAEHSSSSGLDKPNRLFRSVTDDDDDEMEDVTQQMPSTEYESEDSQHPNEPFSHHMAKTIGLSSQRMQVMKASFFQEKDDLMTGAEESTSVFTPKKSSTPMFAASLQGVARDKHILPFFSEPSFSTAKKDEQPYSFKKPPGLLQSIQPRMAVSSPVPGHALTKYVLLPSSKRSPPRSRRVKPTSRLRILLPLSKSLMNDSNHLIADTACFMGRRFRVGWGPNWTLTHCGMTREPAEPNLEMISKKILSHLSALRDNRGHLSSSSFTIVVEKVKTNLSTELDSSLSNLERSLEIQLDNSQGTMENGVPLFVPAAGVNVLHQQSRLTAKLLESEVLSNSESLYLQNCLHVWNLCVALWGNIVDAMHEKNEETIHVQKMARRKAFSEWLQSTSLQKIKEEIQENFDDPNNLQAIFSRLTGCQISEACQLANKSGDHRLSLLLAQASGGMESREIVKKQLQNWEEIKADGFISYSRMKIYALLAASLVWPSSDVLVNTCEDLDWKRALGLHLWYSCSPVASIPDALAEYERAFKGKNPFGSYSQPPLPPYLENNPDVAKSMSNEDNPHKIRDVCYHLLKLYVKRSHRLDRVLCPTAFTADHLDHRLSWLLYQCLQSVGYQHLSDYQAVSLHLNFASQLEAIGLWHWAIFVILHVTNPDKRFSEVMNILQRHINLTDNHDVEQFLCDKLLLPKRWIDWAKALKARHEHKLPEEAWFLLKAGHWNRSHKIVLENIAPDAIINESYDYLEDYLVELAPPERSASILDWNIGGQVFMDYIHVSKTLNRIIKGELDTYELERLQPEVMSLCNRINSVCCKTAKERLCQSEMAKKTATLLRAVLTLQHPERETISAVDLAPHLQRLPMPEDYALQELRALTHNYLLEMTT